MISDYLKKYSNYYLSRYSVTKKKFEDILKKKIAKDFFEKKINEHQYNSHLTEISEVVEYYKKIGIFDEKRLLEISFRNFVNRGYSKKRIRFKILNAKFDSELVNNFLNIELGNDELNEVLIRNYIKKTRLIEKQKKLNISDKKVFDKIIKKLVNQGFGYEESNKVLKIIIFDGNLF